MVLERTVAVAATALVAACVASPTPVRLAVPTVAVLAAVRDDIYARDTLSVPPAVHEALAAVLGAHNLRAEAGRSDAMIAGQSRDTARRLEHLNAARGGAEVVVLVETQVAYYAQLSGRFKWNVFAKLSVQRRGRAPLTVDVQIPALLEFDHEREDVALTRAASGLARELGRLLDLALADEASTRLEATALEWRGVAG